MYSIREIYLVFKALKQNSHFKRGWWQAYVRYASLLKSWNKNDSFQRLITWNIPCSSTHEVKPRFALACTVYTEYAFFRQAMKRGYTEFDRSEICFIFSLSRWTKLVNRNMILLNVSHKRSLSQSMSAVSCIPSIFMTNDLSNSSRVKKGHRVTLPSQLSGRYCMKRKRKRKRKKKRNLHFLHSVNFTEFRPFYIRYYSVSSRGICQNRTASYWSF